MRSELVVVLQPVVHDAAHVSQTGKAVLRVTIVAKAAVEAFDAGILRWFARLNEVMPDARSAAHA